MAEKSIPFHTDFMYPGSDKVCVKAHQKPHFDLYKPLESAEFSGK